MTTNSITFTRGKTAAPADSKSLYFACGMSNADTSGAIDQTPDMLQGAAPAGFTHVPLGNGDSVTLTYASPDPQAKYTSLFFFFKQDGWDGPIISCVCDINAEGNLSDLRYQGERSLGERQIVLGSGPNGLTVEVPPNFTNGPAA